MEKKTYITPCCQCYAVNTVSPMLTTSQIGQGEDNSPFCVKEEKNEEVGIWDLY